MNIRKIVKEEYNKLMEESEKESVYSLKDV